MKDNIQDIAEKFKKGKIGIFPTDTAFGIGCRMDNSEAVKKIYAIRNRPAEKSLLVLVSSIKMAQEYVYIDDEVHKKLIDNYWPGGLTIIFPSIKGKIIPAVNANGTTLAIRLPDNDFLREVIERVGVPIVAPSANFSGENTPFEISEIDPALIQKVDFVVDGMCTMKGVSTIIDVTKKPWKVIRKGIVDITG